MVLLPGLSAWAGPFYINSQGARVELRPTAVLAPDWARGARAAFVGADGKQVFYLDREFIVRLREPWGRGELEAMGLSPLRALNRAQTSWLCRAADAQGALAGAVAAAGLAEVVWAVPDFILPVRLLWRPADPFYSRQWHLHQEAGGHIRAEEAWEISRGDPVVVVAVIDTGIEPNHPDLGPDKVIHRYNAVDDNEDSTPYGDALGAHGTSCAGVVAATADNGLGVAGVCPRCSLMDVKSFDGPGASISAGIEAITYPAENGAWVLSLSWVYSIVDPQVDLEPVYQAIRDAVVQGRGGKGAVVVFSAGNGGIPIVEVLPQNMPEVMAVGGTGPDDQVVSYSAYGPNLSVVAPTWTGRGEDPAIMTTDTLGDRGHSRGGWYWKSGPEPDYEDSLSDLPEPDVEGDYTAYFSGTSASCPMVAGVVALVFSVDPMLSGVDARMIVEQTADKVGGVVYDSAGHNDHYGFGRVNAGRALRAAKYGFDRGNGRLCAENLNCQSGACVRVETQAVLGTCAEACLEEGLCAQAGHECTQLAEGIELCLPGCAEQADCADQAVCADGSCRELICSQGPECPVGTACRLEGDDRLCEPACLTAVDCQVPALCLPALGGDLCRAVACDQDEQCPTDTECRQEFCRRILPTMIGSCACQSAEPGMAGLLLWLLFGWALVGRVFRD